VIGRFTDIASLAARIAAVGVATVVMTAGCGVPNSLGPMSGIVGRTVVDAGDSNNDGMFSIGVPAGPYLVRAQNRTGEPMPSAVQVPVTVHAGKPEVVEVRFDSGVR
jgi:hypothetical protein